MNLKNYLALGDSYSIGEQVEIIYSFPYQLMQSLRYLNHAFAAPEIVAKTGWTTNELLSNIAGYRFNEKYYLVTLLIGVNNQYRGRDLHEFEREFKSIFEKAMSLVADPKYFFVLSIPDWGVTPFAEGKDRSKISQEIDDFNLVCRNISEASGINFIDITTAQRIDGNKEEFLANDKLHPSAKEYKKWADKILKEIELENK